MFISSAYAQAAGGASGEMSSLMTFAPFVLIFVIMYFLIIRPQRSQMKRRQEMLNAVRRGDTVVTGGGILGKVTKVNDDNGEVEVEIANDTRIRVLRSTLTDVRVKGEPVTETKTKPVPKTKTVKKTTTKTNVKSEDTDA
ncbi:preprotein translocase subunit YajC [Bartonella tamiae]|uniref:Sec translocon accessory complex subunit YajC n=1 Tax=Bartonella tamiae Th239 TaxID=1094558 RepID=J0R4V7_9HYPH|nr:preprotein translocase subunit YajC [Bartonella tamiae]EJF90704.1 preprotein translocase, YajC subunit [Bartonella tamiae Th239]EJF93919.1 preprotein translocase, YajC subunit [Bartonella tamiae Th307]